MRGSHDHAQDSVRQLRDAHACTNPRRPDRCERGRPRHRARPPRRIRNRRSGSATPRRLVLAARRAGRRARGRRCTRPLWHARRPARDTPGSRRGDAPGTPRAGEGMIRIGIVGCGHIGAAHAYALRQLADAGLVDAQLTATFDQEPDRAAKMAKYHGGEPVATLDVLLDGVDVVWVCTWTGGHLPAVEAAA